MSELGHQAAAPASRPGWDKSTWPGWRPDRRRETGQPPAPAGEPAPVAQSQPKPDIHPGLIAVDFGTSNTTVTLHDPGIRRFLAISPAQRARLRSEFIALIKGQPDGIEVRQEWSLLVERIARRLMREDPATNGTAAVERLASSLEGEASSDALLDRALLEFERDRYSCTDSLRRDLDARLNHCYDAAFNEPPLDLLRLFKVVLQANGNDEIESVIYVEDGSAQTATMNPPAEGADGPPKNVRSYRGLKQRLGRTEQIDETGLTSGELIGSGIGYLMDRANRYLVHNQSDWELAQGKVGKVLVTYPAMASLQVRDALADMAKAAGATTVITSFDEAIAAAMFFVMREFGGTYDPSVEAFAARSHPVPDPPVAGTRPQQWQQHVLIIDIGGGTTDVALLELKLENRTKHTASSGSPQYGRSYKLTPQLLGTTGEAQRGGDYLTLLVFKWIKAIIADHLLTHSPGLTRIVAQLHDRFRSDDGAYQPGGLVRATLTEERSSREIAQRDAELVVPTHWNIHGDQGQFERRQTTFGLLWDVAESAKRELGAGRPYELPVEQIKGITDRALSDVSGGAPADHGQPGGVALTATLSPKDFADLARPVLRDLMRLAADLVSEQLATRSGNRLDRVIFTGRGSRMRMVREELVAVFAERNGSDTSLPSAADRRAIDWDPSAIWIEDSFAKHATSIGACWAESVRREQKDPEDLGDKLSEGTVWLEIDVENLFLFLRGTFDLGSDAIPGSLAPRLLFRTGTEFESHLGDGQLTVRSGWVPMARDFNVYRRKSLDDAVLWSHFSIDDYLYHHPEPGYDPAAAGWPDNVYAMVEVTPDLDMDILICQGKNLHYLIPAGSGCDLLDKPADLRLHATDGRLPGLPAPILVDPVIPGTMFSAGREQLVFPAGDIFTSTFVTADGTQSRGAVSSRLPAPGRDGWKFYLQRDEDTVHFLGTVRREQALPAGGEPASGSSVQLYYTATLDEHGRLRVHRGSPRFRPAQSLSDIARTPGAVFRTTMTAARPHYLESDDPFSGTH